MVCEISRVNDDVNQLGKVLGFFIYLSSFIINTSHKKSRLSSRLHFIVVFINPAVKIPPHSIVTRQIYRSGF